MGKRGLVLHVYRDLRTVRKRVLSEVCVGGWESVSHLSLKKCMCVLADGQYDMWKSVCVCWGSVRIVLQRLSLVCERKQLSAPVLS